jgi:hypothetical protein
MLVCLNQRILKIKNMNEGKVGAPFQYSDIQIHRQQQGHLPIC